MSSPEEFEGSSQAVLICSRAAGVQQAQDVFADEGYDTVIWEVGKPCSIDEDSPPAVILVDSAAAHGDPLGLCQEIRRMPGCDYIPLILLSDDDDATALRRAYDAEVTTVFSKPLDEKAFRRHVQSLGDTGRTLSGVRALRTSATQVLNTMPDAFFIVGSDGLLRQYLGGGSDDPVLSPEAIEGHMIGDIWPRDIASRVMQNIRRALKSRDGCGLQFDLADGDFQSSYEMRLLVQGRDKVLMIIRNLGEGEAIEPSRGDRNSDTLTGLTARDVFMAHFDSLLAEAKLRERGVAIFCIDIDRFTRINETLGRAVGDAVLKVTAQRIERCLRPSDKVARIDDPDDGPSLTRISGDEFVLVLSDIESREDVATVAGRVREAFSEPVAIEGHQLQITPSIGISLYPVDGDSADDLLKNARVALDEAKVMSVDGREFYSDTMKFRALKRFDVKNELRWAIEKEQLELHYLPRIDLQTGHVAGLEALLRWMHPLRGSVPLSEVIPLAEATGLIFPIGEWVIKTACHQAAAWRQDDEAVPPTSVNLSQQEFTRSDLVELVRVALEDSKLPPELLELELTEGMLMRNRQAEAVLQDIESLGVGVVLDDFGQGHSSIANLTTMPIKAIKIDRTFVDGVREPGDKQAICAAMIAMSRELGISVIAEGVESELQVQFLKERGCDAVQGFLYTEPLPAADVPVFLAACREVADETKIIDLETVRKKIDIKTAS